MGKRQRRLTLFWWLAVIMGGLWLGWSFLLPGGVLPASDSTPAESIVINLDQRSLTLYRAGQAVVRYPVAIGKAETPSPIGEFKVVNKSSGVGGAFGTRWLGLNVPWGTYGIHGTNMPWSIGRSASHGCFRMNNRDVEALFPLVPVGTPVTAIGYRRVTGFRKLFRSGSAGQDVVWLQQRLRERGFAGGPADGRFGAGTALAVRSLQAYYGFPVDGVVSQNILTLLYLQ